MTIQIDFVLRGEYIALDALLKATGIASSGGAAKMMVGEGNVLVDGQPELRKTCKLRDGQLVSVADTQVRLRSAPPDDDIAPPAHR